MKGRVTMARNELTTLATLSSKEETSDAPDRELEEVRRRKPVKILDRRINEKSRNWPFPSSVLVAQRISFLSGQIRLLVFPNHQTMLRVPG